MSGGSAEEAQGGVREVSVTFGLWHAARALWGCSSEMLARREKKELQKILDRKRQNSISEARSRDKDKAEG